MDFIFKILIKSVVYMVFKKITMRFFKIKIVWQLRWNGCLDKDIEYKKQLFTIACKTRSPNLVIGGMITF